MYQNLIAKTCQLFLEGVNKTILGFSLFLENSSVR